MFVKKKKLDPKHYILYDLIYILTQGKKATYRQKKLVLVAWSGAGTMIN